MANKKFHVRITFIEPMLGTVPLNTEIYSDYVASKAPQETDTADEMETLPVDEQITRGTTGFHRLNGEPKGPVVIYNYLPKGHFKAAAGALRKVEGSLSSKLTAYKKAIDTLLFVSPRQVIVKNPEGKVLEGELGIMERPLRAQTPIGERVALSRSETIPAGCWMEYEVLLMGTTISEALLREWLEYGAFSGYGCWRNASWGVFSFELKEIKA